MVADRLAGALAARGVHYAWVIVAVAFLYAIFVASALGVPGVLIRPMSQDLGLSIGELSAPQGLRLALFGLTAPFAGGLMLRFGPRRMLTVAGVLLLAGLLLTAMSTSQWQLWLGLGVVLGVAPGLTALQLNAVISSRWFTRRKRSAPYFPTTGRFLDNRYYELDPVRFDVAALFRALTPNY